MKRKLTYLAAAILVLGILLLIPPVFFLQYHLVSAVNPVFLYAVQAIGVLAAIWLSWQLYSWQALWMSILGKAIGIPVSAIMAFMFFDDVAMRLVTIYEFCGRSYASQIASYKVTDIKGARRNYPAYAVIQSSGSFTKRLQIPITKEQYDAAFEFRNRTPDAALCVILIQNTSQSGAQSVIIDDTKDFKKSLRFNCN